jgi:hypothetical protein
MARHQQLVERVASGTVSAARVQEHTQQYLQTHAPEFLADVMDLGLTFVGNLQRSSSTLAAGLYDRVLGPDDQGPSAPEPPIILGCAGSRFGRVLHRRRGKHAPGNSGYHLSRFRVHGARVWPSVPPH